MNGDAAERTRYEDLCRTHLGDGVPYAGAMLAHAARTWPDRIALSLYDDTWTFSHLHQQALRISRLIKERAILPGQRVLIWVNNSFEFYAAYHGAWLAGAVVVPLNVFMQEAEREHVIRDCEPSLIITSRVHEELFTRAGVPVWYVDELPQLPEGEPTVPDRPADQMCVLLYTSGTTGMPKGVMLSSSAVYHNALQGIARLNPQPDDTVWCALPLFHSLMQNACVWSPCISGAHIMLVPALTRTGIIKSLARRPTLVIAVPALWGLLCQMKKYGIDLSSARYLVAGGDALPSKIAMAVELIYGRQICNGYGLSESSPFIAIHTDSTRVTTTCVGRPFAETMVRIVDGDDRSLPPGYPGVLLVKGPQLMLGYYNAPQPTADVLRPDGWLDTGDLAYTDAEGRIYICGRAKDLIKHKGLNIYPQEIENCLMQEPEVTAVGVIGVPDEYGQIPIAYVQAASAPDDLATRLLHRCRTQLALYKVPRAIIIRDKLPLTSTGKVNKKQLLKEHTNPPH